MVDIFDEVDEDLRAERAERLMKKYGWLLVVAACLVVAGVTGWEFWKRHQNQQAATVAARYLAALTAIEQAPALNTAARTAQIGPLQEIAGSATGGYGVLAKLRVAGLMAEAGDMQNAIAVWNSVAADSSVDPLLRDLAGLQATGHQLDQGDPQQLAGRLEALALPGNPWAPLAREQLAMLDLRLGKVADAKLKLQGLSIDPTAPSGLRARVSALLAGLG